MFGEALDVARAWRLPGDVRHQQHIERVEQQSDHFSRATERRDEFGAFLVTETHCPRSFMPNSIPSTRAVCRHWDGTPRFT